MFTDYSDVSYVSDVWNKFNKEKFRIFLWNFDIFTFPWVLAPPWQHPGCWFLQFASLTKLHYQLDRSELGQKLKNRVEVGSLCWFLGKWDSKLFNLDPVSERLDIWPSIKKGLHLLDVSRRCYAWKSLPLILQDFCNDAF